MVSETVEEEQQDYVFRGKALRCRSHRTARGFISLAAVLGWFTRQFMSW